MVKVTYVAWQGSFFSAVYWLWVHNHVALYRDIVLTVRTKSMSTFKNILSSFFVFISLINVCGGIILKNNIWYRCSQYCFHSIVYWSCKMYIFRLKFRIIRINCRSQENMIHVLVMNHNTRSDLSHYNESYRVPIYKNESNSVFLADVLSRYWLCLIRLYNMCIVYSLPDPKLKTYDTITRCDTIQPLFPCPKIKKSIWFLKHWHCLARNVFIGSSRLRITQKV